VTILAGQPDRQYAYQPGKKHERYERQELHGGRCFPSRNELAFVPRGGRR
jgi:hypothetical protein